MKTEELRRKTKPELNKTLQDLQKNLRELRFKLATKKIKNVREIRQTKKDIARILTLLREGEVKSFPKENLARGERSERKEF